MKFSLFNKRGNTLPIVLFFAACGMIVVTLYLAHQGRANLLAYRSPSGAQALLNARSGVYKALELLDSTNQTDSLPTISTLDQIFRMDLFDSITTETDSSEYLTINGDPKLMTLYKDDTVNSSEVAAKLKGIFCLISSESSILKTTRKVEATLGCPAPARPDTVLILENALPVNGSIKGKICQPTAQAQDSTRKEQKKIKYKKFFSALKERVLPTLDSLILDVPLTIQSQKSLSLIPDDVNSHLILDGAFTDITWSEDRKIIVRGDLQISGTFRLENLDITVGGEIRILDESHLENISLFSSGRIFIGDKAQFQGDMIAMGSINIYGNASVLGKSTLLAAGNTDSLSGKRTDIPRNFSILISENASFDGTAVAFGNPGGIKTDPDTRSTGILWAEKLVCHSGELSGIIRAEYLIDCTDIKSDSVLFPSSLKENTFTGTISSLSSIENYAMPYFLGEPVIVNWKEN